ncbi:MAG: hypothetical protein HYZ42_10420 [Bacteroidetes bacterium]|nr:hypothetical protein [Bacteroidota bacterium]
MKISSYKKSILGILLLSIGIYIQSCKKENRDPEWNMDLLLPLAKSTLSIDNLIPDSLLKKGSNGELSVVYQQTLLDTTLADAAKVPDTSITQSFSLADMKLAPTTISKSVSLGQICETGGITGATVIANNGSMLAIGSFSSTASNTQSIDGSALFNNAQITEGYMDIEIINNFPIDLTNFSFNISNQSDNSMVVSDNFAVIPQNGGKVKHTLSLAGKKVESTLLGTILNISSPGSGINAVLIDTAQTCVFNITVRDIKVSSITAVFPSKNLINFDYGFKLLNSQVQLQYVELASGKIHMNMLSSLPENFKIRMSSSQISNNGQPFDLKYTVNKTNSTGSYANTNIDIDLSGYTLDLRGGNVNGYNNLKFNIQAAVDSTGKVSTITKNDTLKFVFELKDFEPKWAKGYFGQSSLSYGPKSINTNIFKSITYGKFSLDKLKLGFIVENGVGIQAKAQIKKLTASNSSSSLDLAGSVLNQPFIITRATDNPYMPATSNFQLTESNSNILNLIQMMPNKIDYHLQLDINPGGNVAGFKDFFYKQSRLKTILNIEAPLAVGFDLFTIADTVKFSVGTVDSEKRINNGLIKLVIDNGYPFDAFVKVVLLDAKNQVVDELFLSNNWVKSGTIATNTPWNCTSTRCNLVENFNSTRISNLSKVKKAAFSVTLVTKNAAVKQIYSNWNFGLKLIADFNYRVGGVKKE